MLQTSLAFSSYSSDVDTFYDQKLPEIIINVNLAKLHSYKVHFLNHKANPVSDLLVLHIKIKIGLIVTSPMSSM